MDDDVEHLINLGVELANRDMAQRLGMRIWTAKNKPIPEVNSAEWEDMIAAGQIMLANASKT